MAAAGAGEAARAARVWHPDVAAARRYAKHRAGEVAFAVIDGVSRHACSPGWDG